MTNTTKMMLFVGGGAALLWLMFKSKNGKGAKTSTLELPPAQPVGIGPEGQVVTADQVPMSQMVQQQQTDHQNADQMSGNFEGETLEGTPYEEYEEQFYSGGEGSGGY